MTILWIVDTWDEESLAYRPGSSDNGLFLWLGDSLFPSRWDRELSARGIERIGLSREDSWALQERFRDEYVEFIAAWPRKMRYRGVNFLDLFSHDGFPLWWLSEPAEKNNLAYPAINYAFQLLLSRELIKKYGPSEAIIRVREERLYLALMSLMADLGVRVIGERSTFLEPETGALWHLRHRLTHMLRTAYSLIVCRRLFRRFTDKTIFKKGTKTIGFYSIFPETWSLDGEKKVERMYGTLPEYLETERDYRTFFLTYFDFCHPSFRRIGRYFSRNRDELKRIVPILAFSRFSEVVRAFLDPIPVIRFLRIERSRRYRESFRFDGIDIYHLLRDEFRRSYIGPNLPIEIILYLGTKHFLGSYGDRFSTFFHFLEFHKWERGLAMASRITGKHHKLVGCQHSTILPMNINYSFSPSEIPRLDKETTGFDSLLPIPPLIVAAGQETASFLSRSGFEPRRLRILGSLRYDREKLVSVPRPPQKTGKVLLPSSIHPRDSLSSIEVTIQACMLLDLSLVVKPHPVYDVSAEALSIARALGFRSIVVTHDPISDILPRVDMVVTTWTTVSLEALVCGCPVIILTYTNSLDVSIFMGGREIPGLRFVSDGRDLPAAMDAIIRDRFEMPLETRRDLFSRYLGRSRPEIIRSVMDLIDEISGDRPKESGSKR